MASEPKNLAKRKRKNEKTVEFTPGKPQTTNQVPTPSRAFSVVLGNVRSLSNLLRTLVCEDEFMLNSFSLLNDWDLHC